MISTLSNAIADSHGLYQKLQYEDDGAQISNGGESESSYETSSDKEESEDIFEDLHHDVAQWNPTTTSEKHFYHLVTKYKKNVNMADEDMDMEQVLQVEWNAFLKEYTNIKSKHPSLEVVAKRFDKLFESLEW